MVEGFSRAFLIMTVLTSGAALAAEGAPPPQRPPQHAPAVGRLQRRDLPRKPAGVENHRVQISANFQELEGSADFVVGDGAQANHVAGGEKVFVVKNGQGEGADFKKWGFVVNIVATSDPRDRGAVRVQLQIELFGPVKGEKVGASDVPSLSTWQWQSSFTATRGRKTLVVAAPARVELTIDAAESR